MPLTLPTAQLNPTSTATSVLAVSARSKAIFTLTGYDQEALLTAPSYDFMLLAHTRSHPLSHPLTAVSPSHYTQQFSIFPN